MCRHLEGMWC